MSLNLFIEWLVDVPSGIFCSQQRRFRRSRHDDERVGIRRRLDRFEQEVIFAVGAIKANVENDCPGSRLCLGSFKSWLMLITRRRIIDHFRKRGREPKRVERDAAETARTATIHRIPDPAGNQFDEAWEDEFQKNILGAALAKVKDKVDPKQFQMFDCSALKGWPVPDIARQMKVTPSQIYTAKHRVGALIKEEVKRLQAKMV